MNYALQFLLIALGLGGIAFWVSQRSQHGRIPLDASTLIVGTNTDYPPFSFLSPHGREIVGFDIDIVKEVAKRLGKTIIFKDMPFDMLLPNLQLGNMQIIAAGASPSPEREGQVYFSKPYLSNDPLIIITRADQSALTSIADLTGKEVIVNDGYTADLYLSSFQGPIIKRLPTVTDAFLALTSKRADAFVAARAAVEPYFEQTDRAKFNIAVLPDISDSYVLMVSRKYPELFQHVQQVLDAMEQDHTLDAIKQKWNLS